MPFKPGQSGNPNGRPVERPWRDAIRAILAEKDPKTQRRKLLSAANALVDQAMAGDTAALREVGDRIDGKPPQSITGADGGAVQLAGKIEIVIVKPDDSSA